MSNPLGPLPCPSLLPTHFRTASQVNVGSLEMHSVPPPHPRLRSFRELGPIPSGRDLRLGFPSRTLLPNEDYLEPPSIKQIEALFYDVELHLRPSVIPIYNTDIPW